MAKKKHINPAILKVARSFSEHISGKGIPLTHVFLFGSWAKGDANDSSDIDLCLVSSQFGKDEIAELQFLLRETRKIDDRIEPLPVSLADYRANSTPLIAAIKDSGYLLRL